jgi:hypothetical protein
MIESQFEPDESAPEGQKTESQSKTVDPPSEFLHLGRRAKDEPLLLDFKKLTNHGAILAGSGAGKSTAVGRIVEEILIKTDARVVVIDTNGDFRKAHLIEGPNEDVWKNNNPHESNIFVDRATFARRWQEHQKLQLTYASNALDPSDESDASEAEPRKDVRRTEPYISWKHLPMQWQMDILELELGRDPDEVAALVKVTQRLEADDSSDLRVTPETIERELQSLLTNSNSAASAERKAATALQMRFLQLKKLNIWKKRAEDSELLDWFAPLPPGPDAFPSFRPQLITFDVPSVSDLKSRNILVASLLNALWKAAQRDWEAAVDAGQDQRVPTFLVVDEAHNFVPAEDSVDPHALRISQGIQRIAAEGRKYGLFLLLVTQRPSKVRPGLLSECENICLLRLRSPIERGLAVETWALHDDHRHPRLSRLASFDKGHGLLCGHWADWDEIEFSVGRRRTKATGGDLGETWIKKQPPAPTWSKP